MICRGKFGSKTWSVDRLFHQQLQKVTPYIHGIVVDLGCGDKRYEALLNPNASQYIGVDKLAHEADIVADVTKLPLATGSIDTVICFSVLDDIKESGMFLDEVYRVLRPDGVLLLSVNQLWRTHDPPYDYLPVDNIWFEVHFREKSFYYSVDQSDWGALGIHQHSCCVLAL